jgi:hypothetical protein
MAPCRPRPTPRLGFTQREAAHVLGCSISYVRTLIVTGQLDFDRSRRRTLDRDQVEQLAAQRWRSDRHIDDATSYWVTTAGAAHILGVGQNRVRQLVARGFLPCLSTGG